VIGLWVLGMAINSFICTYDVYVSEKNRRAGYFGYTYDPKRIIPKYLRFVLGSWVTFVVWALHV